MDNLKAGIAELESVETSTVCRHEEILEKVIQRHAEEIAVWKGTSAENVESLINDVKVANSNSIKMPLERNLSLAGLEEHVCALQALVITNVE